LAAAAIPNAVAGPSCVATAAPKAGPPARATVIGTLLSAMAAAISPGRIRDGTIECMAGPPTTNPRPTTREAANTGAAPGSPSTPPASQIQSASPPEPSPVRIRPATICSAAWPRSAIFPLSGANSSWGANCTAVTAPTTKAERVSSKATIAATMLWIQIPEDESTLPQKNGPKTGSTISR
jgi:hypothetical protein